MKKNAEFDSCLWACKMLGHMHAYRTRNKSNTANSQILLASLQEIDLLKETKRASSSGGLLFNYGKTEESGQTSEMVHKNILLPQRVKDICSIVMMMIHQTADHI